MAEHLSLSEFLHPLVAAIKGVASSQWVAAEIAEVNGNHHLYLTLIEHDAEHKKVAELRASLWASGKTKLLERFEFGTGGERLRKGLKVLIKLRPALSPVLGLTATVEDIDPSFTLGEAARKLIALRERLIAEGSYERQRLLAPPAEFTSLAIVCPAGAAGLGDFKSHADPLEALGLCAFTYFTATFQGERASPEIVEALRQVYREHGRTPFDALIVLRGGGSQADLAWLNDYAIANAISKMPLPVLVAIGHERDSTILDEIANLSFHTPSKAIAHVAGTITANAREALGALEAIWANAAAMSRQADKQIDHIQALVRHFADSNLAEVKAQAEAHRSVVVSQACRAVDVCLSELDGHRRTLADGARRQAGSAEQMVAAAVGHLGSDVASVVATVGHELAAAQAVISGTAGRGLALAQQDVAGCLGLIRDRALLARDQMARDVAQLGSVVNDHARRQLQAVGADMGRHRQLVRDRSLLGVETIRATAKAEAELVIGIGPRKTLARGFSVTRKRGKAITRKTQVAAGDAIEVEFADGNVGAIVQ